jgi:hypothetical protein
LQHAETSFFREEDRNLAFRRRRGNPLIRQKLLATRFRYLIAFCRAGVAWRGLRVVGLELGHHPLQQC